MPLLRSYNPKPIGSVEKWADRFKALSQSTQNLKERSLYVDFRRGKILLPTQVTEKRLANRSRPSASSRLRRQGILRGISPNDVYTVELYCPTQEFDGCRPECQPQRLCKNDPRRQSTENFSH